MEDLTQQKQDRATALYWWDMLTLSEAKELAAKYKPNWTFEMVSKSSSTIQTIWEQEINPL